MSPAWSFNDFVYMLDGVLLLILAISATREWAKVKNFTRFNIVLLFASLGLGTMFATRPVWTVTAGWSTLASVFLIYSKPVVLMFLLDQFLDVSRAAKQVAWFCQAVTWAVILFVWKPVGELTGAQTPLAVAVVTALYYIPAQIIMLWALVKKHRESQGLTRVRLKFAAAGEALFVVAYLFEFAAGKLGYTAYGRNGFLLFFTSCILAYYLGFVTPRWFRSLWQGIELRGFLRKGLDRTGPQRSNDTMKRLTDAAQRGIGADRIEIGLWNPKLEQLRIWFENAPESRRQLLNHADGLCREVWETGSSLSYPGSVAPSQDEISLLKAAGARGMTVVPIGKAPHRMGVLIALTRRESLFPEDDQEFLRLVADQAALVGDLQRAFSTLSWYVRMLSHELRNELNPLPTSIKLLKQKSAPDAASQLHLLEATVQSISALVTDLSSLAHLQDPDVQWVTKRTDVAENVRQELIRHMDLLEASGIEVDASGISEAPVLALTVPDKLSQVVHNLLENSLKYSVGGGWLAVRVFPKDTWVRVEIEDRGKGVLPEQAGLIFTPYYRAPDASHSAKSGRGLGLTFISEVISYLGGRIAVDSPPEGGARFWFELPAGL